MKAIAIAFIACGTAVPASAQSQNNSTFERYQAMERGFDPAVADLYCDNAIIRNTRTYPDGQQRTLEIPAPKYKQLIRTSMPMAKAKGDYSTYSDIKYSPEGLNTRINASRYSVLKKYSSPISILLGPCGDSWGIIEEISQSQP
ncbi:hypothetical protein [Pseudoduganella violaceinigra]|uniref:hypothetical protein n=1 Tax=Pseudoduganella violaceinigra TaxID=246602 RepID=UPI0012B52CED|nr:hypothetical protein [Pseudoduganella violaceinigra]